MCGAESDPTTYDTEATTVSGNLTDYTVTHRPEGGSVVTLRRADDDEGRNVIAFTVAMGESDTRRLAGALTPPYNGWVNWETWNANLWLTNDEGTYRMARELAARVNYEGRHAEDAFVAFVEEVAFGGSDEAPATLGTDFIREALRQVDYRELVAALTEGDEDDPDAHSRMYVGYVQPQD